MSGGFLLQAIIYLAAAITCVPIAKRLGLSSVLGYLIAGILIGPFLLGFIGEEGEDIMHFAEFGVVMMLFLIGLELEPQKFWKMRKMILGMGVMQMGLTAAIVFGIFMFMNFRWEAALSIALALSMSSTAIVLQTLKEKGLIATNAGQSSFAVLLFQDIAVIPILAILPLLAFNPVAEAGEAQGSFVEELPALARTVAVLAAVGAVVAAGRFIIVPLLRIIAKTHLRELFTASALLIVVGIAFLMELVGLSPALGTFLAGVVLANSEFKHELESDLDPFKGLLLGLFFIAVGASINFNLITERPFLILALVAGIMIIKALVIAGTGKLFSLKTDQNLLFALGLSQVGEFAFVLFSFIGQLRILNGEWTGIMMAVTAITMTITPLLLLANDKWIISRIGTKEKEDKPADDIDEKNPVIIVGFSHFGSTIGRFLRANKINATILDNNSDQVDLLRKMGFKVYYGDATRVDLLESAGAHEAKLMIIAIGTPETNIDLVKTVKKHFPHMEILVRAKNRFDAYQLIDAGATNIYRESLDTSIRLGVDVLRKLGYRGYSASRQGQNFLKYDEQALWKLSDSKHDMKQYISNVRQQIELQEQLLKADLEEKPNDTDHAWDSEFMRESILKKN